MQRRNHQKYVALRHQKEVAMRHFYVPKQIKIYPKIVDTPKPSVIQKEHTEIHKPTWKEKHKVRFEEKLVRYARQYKAYTHLNWSSFLHPLQQLQYEFTADHTTLHMLNGLIIHIVFWLLIGFQIAKSYADIINAHAFSFGLINFTSTSWIALRLMVLGLISEYLLFGLFGFVNRFFHSVFGMKKIVSACSKVKLIGIYGLILIAIVGFFIKGLFPLLFIGLLLMILFLNLIAIHKTSRFPLLLQAILFAFVMVLIILFSQKYMAFVFEDLHRIMQLYSILP